MTYFCCTYESLSWEVALCPSWLLCMLVPTMQLSLKSSVIMVLNLVHCWSYKLYYSQLLNSNQIIYIYSSSLCSLLTWHVIHRYTANYNAHVWEAMHYSTSTDTTCTIHWVGCLVSAEQNMCMGIRICATVSWHASLHSLLHWMYILHNRLWIIMHWCIWIKYWQFIM